MTLYALALSQLAVVQQGSTSQPNSFGEESQLKEIKKIQSHIKDMLNSAELHEMIDNPNLVTLKLVTRALQIIDKTSNVDLPGMENCVHSMTVQFMDKVRTNKFFVHVNTPGLDDANEDFQTIRGVLYYLMEELPYIPSDL